MNHKKKIVVAITGASGAIYADLLLKKIATLEDQIDNFGVVMSRNASEVWAYELKHKDYTHYTHKTYDAQDFTAPFASGSAGYDTMIIVPCSMGTMARIAGGISNDLITRAADVILKERRKLICVVRETPYNLIHIQNMEKITLAGGIICPASPSFYHKPQSIEACVNSVVERALQLAGLELKKFSWGEEKK